MNAVTRRLLLSATLLLGISVFFWSSIRAAESQDNNTAQSQNSTIAQRQSSTAQAYGTAASPPAGQGLSAAAAYGVAPDGHASVSLDKAHGASLDKVHGSYSFLFGPDLISAPGNALSATNKFLDPKDFPDATYCGHCHQEAYHQWRQSLHASSFRTPFYRTSVNLLIHTKGIEFARHCDSCHNPVAVLSGSLDSHATGDRSFDRDGLTCMVCHSIQKVDTKLGNGSYTMGVPAVMVDAQGTPIAGMVPDSEILMHLDRHSKAVMRDIYKSPQFCSACHKANFPVALNDYKWIRGFTTYDEWQQSKFSQQNPLTFYTADFTTCQGCHMKREPITLPDPGAKHGMLALHRWPAGNTAVPFYYGYQEQLDKTVEFLKSGNYLNVDIFGLQSGQDAAVVGPLGTVGFSVKPRELLTAYVVVQNKNIGHSLVPEVRDLYEAWVQFTVTDATGKSLYKSGYLRPDGTLDPGAHSFTNRPVNADGNFVDNHRVWTIHSVAYDNSITAGRSTLLRYQFQLPKELAGPVTLKAAVEYRHFRQTYLNNVFGPDHPAYPVVELSASSRTLSLGDNPPTPAGRKRQPGMDALEQPGHRLSGPAAIRRSAACLRAGGSAASGLQGRLRQSRGQRP